MSVDTNILIMRQRDVLLAETALLGAQKKLLLRRLRAMVSLVKRTGEMRDPHLYLTGHELEEAEEIIKLAGGQ